MSYNRDSEYTVTIGNKSETEDIQVYATDRKRAVEKALERSSFSGSGFNEVGVNVAPMGDPSDVMNLSELVPQIKDELSRALFDGVAKQIKDEAIQNILQEISYQAGEVVRQNERIQAAEDYIIENGSEIMVDYSYEIARITVRVIESYGF
jgi:hypothetical protein